MRYACIPLALTLLFMGCDQGGDECPDVPVQNAVFFPFNQGQQWRYLHQYERTTGPRDALVSRRTVEADVDWELEAVRCQAGAYEFSLQVTVTASTVEKDFRSGDELTDFVFDTGVVEGRTEGDLLFIPHYTGEQATSQGSAHIVIPVPRWHYPAAVGDTVTVDTTWTTSRITGTPLQAVSRITLVRDEGIVAWYVKIGTDADTYEEESSTRLVQ